MNEAGAVARYGRVFENGRSRKVGPESGVPVRPIFGGNWKMHGAKGAVDIKESLALAEAIRKALVSGGYSTHADVFVAPPPAYLTEHARQLFMQRNQGFALAAQNPFPGTFGAATGQTSIGMIAAIADYTRIPIPYLIIGHSEPRSAYGLVEGRVRWVLHNTQPHLTRSAAPVSQLDEKFAAAARRALGLSPELINLTVRDGLTQGFQVVLCVGETLAERDLGFTEGVVLEQLRSGLAGVTAEQADRVIIAYEPVWAIGTGQTATPEQAQEVHHVIRHEGLVRLFDRDRATGMRIQYGGSMNSGNVDALMAQPDIDGGLIGGAALDAGSFVRIVNYQEA